MKSPTTLAHSDLQTSTPHDVFNILLTGGAGFVCSHLTRGLFNFLGQRFVEARHPNTTFHLYILDKLDYCASLRNIQDVLEAEHPRIHVHFIEGDILSLPLTKEPGKSEDKVADTTKSQNSKSGWGSSLGPCSFAGRLPTTVQVVVHAAALSSVDASFTDPFAFTQTNVIGTQVCLEFSKSRQCKLFLYISTDEVYGSHTSTPSEETTMHCPTNPYAASKSAGESLVQAYGASFKIPFVIVRSNNIYGPMQYPEKIIPRFIQCLLDHEPCPIQGAGLYTRRYLFVSDFVDAILLILQNHCNAFAECFTHPLGRVKACSQRQANCTVYNIGTEFEISNLNLLHELCKLILGVEDPQEVTERTCWIPDRPFNDEGYPIDSTKITTLLGWEPKVSFNHGLLQTIDWYRQQHEAAEKWWK